MKAKVNCRQCGKEFEVQPSTLKAGRGIYCSRKGFGEARSHRFVVENHPRWNRIEKLCLSCGKPFYAKRYLVEKGYGKYCSKKWADKALKGESSSLWKGGPDVHECPVCGREFEVYPYQVKRGVGKYCSKKCAGEARRKRVKTLCLHCGAEFLVIPSKLKAGEGKYCSKRCAGTALGIQQSGERNPFWKGGPEKRICETCGKEFEIQRRRVGKTPSRFCSYNCYWVFMQGDAQVKERMEEVRAEAETKYPTKLESQGYSILDSIGIDYRKQCKVADKFLVDAFVPENNLVIQFDGDYWHGNPAKYKMAQVPDKGSDNRKVLNKLQKGNMRKDKGQNAYLRKCGYEVLRFWESDVKNDPESVRLKIIDAINSYSSEDF